MNVNFKCKKRFVVLMAMPLALFGCGGASESEPAISTHEDTSIGSLTPKEALILSNEYLAEDFVRYIDNGNTIDYVYEQSTSDYTSRWPSTSVNVYIEEQPEGSDYYGDYQNTLSALELLNGELSANDVTFSLNRVFSVPAEGADYIHVSFGTAYYGGELEPDRYQLSVGWEKFGADSFVPYDANARGVCGDEVYSNTIYPTTETSDCNVFDGHLKGVAYLNIDGPHVTSGDVQPDTIYDGFMKTMGFPVSINAFEPGDYVSEDAKEILYKLYSYPVATPYTNVSFE